jgi:hypothetical protein
MERHINYEHNNIHVTNISLEYNSRKKTDMDMYLDIS